MDEKSKQAFLAMGVSQENLHAMEAEIAAEIARGEAALAKLFSLEGLAEVIVASLCKNGWRPGPTPQGKCGLIPPGSENTKYAFAVGLGTAWQMALDDALTNEMLAPYKPKRDDCPPTDPAPALPEVTGGGT
jgi:hypothetical protein